MCPWDACASRRRDGPGFSYSRCGYYSARLRSQVPRFRCRVCLRTFSSQTFSRWYYAKRPEIVASVAARLGRGFSLRRIARDLECAASTVSRLAWRISERGRPAGPAAPSRNRRIPPQLLGLD